MTNLTNWTNKSNFLNLTRGLFSLIYPPLCEVCGARMGQDEKYSCLCQNCLNQMRVIKPAVPLKRRNMDVWALCIYDGIAKECIHLLKYNARLSLAEPLGNLMSAFLDTELVSEKFDMIIPVPLHRIRLREREFNQAEALAKRLASRAPVCADALKRIKPTQSQTGLSKTKRFTNLRSAFKINNDSFVRGKRILLIDDVFTTGSTVCEAARILLRARAKSVSALVLARGI